MLGLVHCIFCLDYELTPILASCLYGTILTFNKKKKYDFKMFCIIQKESNICACKIFHLTRCEKALTELFISSLLNYQAHWQGFGGLFIPDWSLTSTTIYNTGKIVL